MDDRTGQQPGLFASVSGLARNAIGLVISRIELAAVELGEVRGQLLKLLLVGALGVLAVWFALAYWSLLIVMLAWPKMGWTILAVLGAVFTLAALLLFRRAQSMLREDKLSMPATMAELRSDRDALL
ncbi:phage holin family protein [Lacisediminimonas profundi]|uniref:phage holin family protein n=1 Tax=Lacisediminimonas profundi TaxID=2603856 RepID=UPI00124B5998|nr:phage holin family protein [Lacisediminimonas profundi]